MFQPWFLLFLANNLTSRMGKHSRFIRSHFHREIVSGLMAKDILNNPRVPNIPWGLINREEFRVFARYLNSQREVIGSINICHKNVPTRRPKSSHLRRLSSWLSIFLKSLRNLRFSQNFEFFSILFSARNFWNHKIDKLAEEEYRTQKKLFNRFITFTFEIDFPRSEDFSSRLLLRI